MNLEVRYDKDVDILRMIIPGRSIAATDQVSPPLIIDFGSKEDGFDVVGFELTHASEHLAPFFKLASESVAAS